MSESINLFAPEPPELVIGLVGAIGTDLERVEEGLQRSLRSVDYRTEVLRLSRYFSDLGEAFHEEDPWRKIPDKPLDERYKALMDAGDTLREHLQRGDAVALLGVARLSGVARPTINQEQQPASRRVAYILHSLKNPAEVRTLRDVYGPNFVLVGAYAPLPVRIEHLTRRIADSRHESPQNRAMEQRARELIERDERDSRKRSDLLQNVRDTFPMADIFIDTSDQGGLQNHIDRFIKLIFGYPYHTPSRDEFSMFLAQAAALRSADLGRQVGAVIASGEGDVIALGTNEVPKGGGGQYWEGDQNDRRDFQNAFDSSARYKRIIINDTLRHLARAGLVSSLAEDQIADFVERAVSGLPDSPLEGARLMNLIEFGRAVHAEMSALMDAARRGVSVRGHTLYTTTFPCHECTRHIIAAGIARVVYIEPYPKSLAPELHPDAIQLEEPGGWQGRVIFQPFVGVAPRLYMEVFGAGERKTGDGKVIEWTGSAAIPRWAGRHPAVLVQIRETNAIDIFKAGVEGYLVGTRVSQDEEARDGGRELGN